MTTMLVTAKSTDTDKVLTIVYDHAYFNGVSKHIAVYLLSKN